MNVKHKNKKIFNTKQKLIINFMKLMQSVMIKYKQKINKMRQRI